MKCLVIYESIHHKNTLKIAQVIAKVLQADLKHCSEINLKDLEKYDLIGFGSGIYAFRHHRNLFNLVNNLPQLNKKVFVFSTSGAKDGQKYHRPLNNKLQQKGYLLIGEFNCQGWDTFGPFKLIGGLNKNRPDTNDIEKAKKFAQDLKTNFHET